ncbi:MAG: hypothetical protein ACXVPQ_01705 [Bacteroidia bacterium]
MKTRFLFPHRFKKAGWVMLALGLALLIADGLSDGLPFLRKVPVIALYNSPDFAEEGQGGFFKLITDDVNFELCTLFLVLGSLLVAFSRTRHEDEFISKLREESLVWATYAQYILLAVSIVCLYGTVFLDVMVYNLFSMLWIFIVKFHYEIHKASKSLTTTA